MLSEIVINTHTQFGGTADIYQTIRPVIASLQVIVVTDPQGDIIKFIDISKSESYQTMLASEAILGEDWNSPEEDKAWANL